MESEYRGFKIVGDGTYGMKVVKQIGRGAVPASLKGFFTTDFMAKKLIDQHLSKKGISKNEEASTG